MPQESLFTVYRSQQLFLEPPNTTHSDITEVHSWTLIQLVNDGKGILTPIWPFPSEKDSSS